MLGSFWEGVGGVIPEAVLPEPLNPTLLKTPKCNFSKPVSPIKSMAVFKPGLLNIHTYFQASHLHN